MCKVTKLLKYPCNGSCFGKTLEMSNIALIYKYQPERIMIFFLNDHMYLIKCKCRSVQ